MIFYLKNQFPNSHNQTQIDVLNARLHYLKDEHQKAKKPMGIMRQPQKYNL